METFIQLLQAQPWLAAGIAVGVIARTLWPWLTKHPIPAFDAKALIPAVGGAIGATAVAVAAGGIVIPVWWVAAIMGIVAGVGGMTMFRYLLPFLKFK